MKIRLRIIGELIKNGYEILMYIKQADQNFKSKDL